MAKSKAVSKAQQPPKQRATKQIPAAGTFNNNRRLVAVPKASKPNE